jgi:acyl-CoA hydrolase
MRKLTLADAAALLREGDTVYLGGCAGEPSSLIDAVAAQHGLWRDVTLTGAFIPGVNDRDYSAIGVGTSAQTIFATSGLREGRSVGRVSHLPISYTAFWDRLSRRGAIDIAFVQITPARADGTVGFGIAGDFGPGVALGGARMVGLVNPSMPDPVLGPRLPVDRFEALVDMDAPLTPYEPASLDPVSARIGENVAALVEEGDTIQLGLGKVQAAVLASLTGRKDLGFHGGMIAPAMVPHLSAGTFGLGVTTGVALGSQAFYREITSFPDVDFRPVGSTHALPVLGGIRSFVAINSVLEVDLFGQANAEIVEGRQISGQGGLVDFVRGARCSPGGRSILALASTASRGTVSRIVPTLASGTPATVARADADIVVTEYGAAHLRDVDVEERARRLVQVAHPAFRDELARAWGARAQTHAADNQ